MRTFKIKLLGASGLFTIETSATTLGELKREIPSDLIAWSNSKLIHRDTRVSYELDSSVLPSTNAMLFVMPLKQDNGGMYDDFARAECIETIKELREEGVIIPFNSTRTSTEDLRKFLNNRTKKAVANKSKPVVNQKVSTNSSTIKLSPGRYTIVVEETAPGEEYIHISKLVDTTTLDDIDNEVKALEKEFKSI